MSYFNGYKPLLRSLAYHVRIYHPDTRLLRVGHWVGETEYVVLPGGARYDTVYGRIDGNEITHIEVKGTENDRVDVWLFTKVEEKKG